MSRLKSLIQLTWYDIGVPAIVYSADVVSTGEKREDGL